MQDARESREKYIKILLYFYRARYKITQLSISTHAQLQRERLKFIKNHLKNSYMEVFMLRVVMWQHVVLFVLGYT